MIIKLKLKHKCDLNEKKNNNIIEHFYKFEILKMK